MLRRYRVGSFGLKGCGMLKREYPVVDPLRTGQNIKRIMKARGLSVKDVQRFLGFEAPQGIYHWFDGRSMPTLDNLYALSELFCVPIDTIVKGNRLFLYTPFPVERFNALSLYYEKLYGLKAG